MERKNKRLLLLAGICSLLIVGTISLIYFYVIIPESEEYELELKVGYYDNKPKVYEDDEGNVKGIFPEILEYIADQEDWKIEWVYGSWEECLDRVENGKIDIMVDVAYSENRSQLYDFNSVEVLSNWGIIYSDA
ncbi:MAG: transporter substrate-binding domain-containing protein, partial [Promethearchaeota archaeon]